MCLESNNLGMMSLGGKMVKLNSPGYHCKDSGCDSTTQGFIWSFVVVIIQFYISLFKRQSSHLLELGLGLKLRLRSWGLNPGLSFEWQEPNHLSNHHCLPASALIGSWTQEPMPGIEPRYSSVGHRRLYCQAQHPTQSFLKMQFSGRHRDSLG